jgi:NADP-dependent 3-hydroxy acid dehydrogenase YdfG
MTDRGNGRTFLITVVITGASAGLGAALAEAYAAPGCRLVLIARNHARLAGVAERCNARGAVVVTGAVDVTDRVAMSAFIGEVAVGGPIDLVIANAGVFTGRTRDGELETLDDISWMVRTNIEGVANVVQPALIGMRTRKRGHIAIIGSLAALQPLADAPGYSASKAGVMAYGEALQEYLIPDRICVSLVYPGHIETAQIAHHVGALPLLVSPERAAALIKRRLDARRTFIAFPWQLLWLIRLGRGLPWRLRALASRDFRFSVSAATKKSGED